MDEDVSKLRAQFKEKQTGKPQRIAYRNSQQLWVQAQNQHKINPDKILGGEGKGLMKF